MAFDLTLCPACICEYEKELGDESYSRIVQGVQFKLCKRHQDRNFDEECGNADEKLQDDYQHKQMRFYRGY